METVRDQILLKGKVDSASVSGTFPADWQYCPCVIVQKCTVNRVCSVRIGILCNDPRIGIFSIEVIYIGDKRQGFVRVNHMKLNQLIEMEIIDPVALQKVSF